jgi:hypothetical protein
MTLNFIGKFAWNFGQNEFFSSLLRALQAAAAGPCQLRLIL